MTPIRLPDHPALRAGLIAAALAAATLPGFAAAADPAPTPATPATPAEGGTSAPPPPPPSDGELGADDC